MYLSTHSTAGSASTAWDCKGSREQAVASLFCSGQAPQGARAIIPHGKCFWSRDTCFWSSDTSSPPCRQQVLAPFLRWGRNKQQNKRQCHFIALASD